MLSIIRGNAEPNENGYGERRNKRQKESQVKNFRKSNMKKECGKEGKPKKQTWGAEEIVNSQGI